jgi:tetratricopeptide (TPR) repeat protein
MRRMLLALLTLALALQPTLVLATCGGGGGGGLGGVAPGGAAPQVYRVSWKVVSGSALPKAPEASLVVLWFATTPEAARTSGLQTSRALSLAGARCVAAALATPDNTALHQGFNVAAGVEAAVLVDGAGKELGRVAAEAGKALDARPVEKLLTNEIERREEELEALLKAADKKAETDKAGATADLERVWAERCLFPNLGKKAAKELKKLGVAVEAAALSALGLDGLADADLAGKHARVEALLVDGLKAEIEARYLEAEKLYRQASEADPADPTALRFWAELHRHHTGDWALSRSLYERLLAQPADPLARAVALHGLGKMTIHDGRFDDGVAMFYRSLEVFPLPITYRNLAVYWFSERQAEKATGYMRQALALEPDDRYNQIFAAVYLSAAGQHQEALAVAKANEDVMEASYNLAAIYAQAGDRKKAMELLRRHFYEYERFDAVRAMEMKEARDDYMFASLHQDPAFVELTKLAGQHSMIGR